MDGRAVAVTEPFTKEQVLVVRPRRTSRVAVAAAVVIVAVFSTTAAKLHGDATGVYFRPADQVAMALFGVLLAAAVLLLTRPRLRADAHGVGVRNVLGEKVFPWDLVTEVSFPDGASFARVELPDDEYVTIMAIQSSDGARAVRAMQRLRELQHTYGGG
jgi:acyl-CoA synthetase (AMP-forming)/AMP-acid ligase II